MKKDLPIDTPVMVNFAKGLGWELYYYAGNGRVWCGCYRSDFWKGDTECTVSPWRIVPFKSFNPYDMETTLKFNINNTNEL